MCLLSGSSQVLHGENTDEAETWLSRSFTEGHSDHIMAEAQKPG